MSNIFVIEDGPEMAMLLKVVLEEDNHEVTLFSDSQQAAARLEAEIPDVIVLDVMLPKVDGYTLCAGWDADPRLSCVPVIVVTAKGSVREMFKAHPNVTAFLEKPFNNVVLQHMVERALKKKNSV